MKENNNERKHEASMNTAMKIVDACQKSKHARQKK